MDRRLTKRLPSVLCTPPDAGGSSFLTPSLEVAEKLAAVHSDHTVVLHILSDMELMDDAGIFDRLRAFPGDIHAVLLDRTPPLELYGDNIAITEMHQGDPVGLAAEAMFRSLTATRPGARRNPALANRTRPSVPPLSAA